MWHLSPSQIATFERCSLQWFFRYRAKLYTRPTSYLAVGKSVHASVEADYGTKATTGELAPLELIKEIVADSFESLSREVLFDSDEDPGQIKDSAVAMAEFHHHRIAPSVSPKSVETWLDIVVQQSGLGRFLIHQRADVITTDEKIVDIKTSTYREGTESAKINPQLTSYALGYSQNFGSLPKAVELHRIIQYRKNIDKEIVSGVRGLTEFDRYLKKVVRVADRMLRNDVYPVDNIRTCMTCPFRPICWGHDFTAYLADPSLAVQEAQRRIPNVLESDKSGA